MRKRNMHVAITPGQEADSTDAPKEQLLRYFQIKAIVPEAYAGRIGILFVAVDRHLWGSFDPHTMTVSVHLQAVCGNEELLDLAAMQTLLHGGAVYAVEQRHVPGETLAAALFRY